MHDHTVCLACSFETLAAYVHDALDKGDKTTAVLTQLCFDLFPSSTAAVIFHDRNGSTLLTGHHPSISLFLPCMSEIPGPSSPLAPFPQSTSKRLSSSPLLPVPHPRNLGHAHLPLQLENTIHERLTGGRAPGDVHIDGHDPIAPPHNAVAVVVVAAAVGARAHGDDPARLGHLVVDLAQRGRHLVGEGAGHDHDVRLAGRGTEDDAHAVLVVARGRQVHHFDGAAGEAEGHGPKGGLAAPVDDLVEGRPVFF